MVCIFNIQDRLVKTNHLIYGQCFGEIVLKQKQEKHPMVPQAQKQYFHKK